MSHDRRRSGRRSAAPHPAADDGKALLAVNGLQKHFPITARAS